MEGSELRKWDELIPDALGLIFRNLSLEDTLTVIPRVCKAWARAVKGPYCWQEIDIEEWSRCASPEHHDKMLQMLVHRSGGSPHKLCISGLISDHSFSFIADHAKSLQTLQLSESEISDAVVHQMAGKLWNITYLDLSYCVNIGAHALEAIGTNCKGLRYLIRSMHPWTEKLSRDDEALAIASTMLGLRHLVIDDQAVTTKGVLAIIHNCTQLEFLDIQGCWNVALEDAVLKMYPKLDILGPNVIDPDDYSWDDDYARDYTSDNNEWDYDIYNYGYWDEGFWDGNESMDDVELRFYGDLHFSDDVAIDWPPSP